MIPDVRKKYCIHNLFPDVVCTRKYFDINYKWEIHTNSTKICHKCASEKLFELMFRC